MAYTAFSLAKKLNEASFGYVPSNIEPWKFAGDSHTAMTSEMNNEIMAEAATYHEFVVNTDEMLAETAMENPDRLMDLHEGVFATIKEKVIAFFNKLIAMVKGVIEKLKASFYKMTNQIGKWVGIMRPKIEKAAGESGMADVTYEMYDYQEPFILKGLCDKLGGLEAKYKADAKLDGAQELSKLAAHIKESKQGFESGAADHAGRAYDDNDSGHKDEETGKAQSNRDYLDEYINTWNSTRDTWKGYTDDFKKDFPSTVGSILGVGGTTMDAVEANIYKEARGSEKKELKIGSKATAMLKTVENSKDTISDLKKVYETHLKFLETAKAQLDKVDTSFEPKPADKKATIPGEVTTAAREAYTATFNHITTVTSAYETQMGKVRQININLIQNMTSEYMSALTKFAGYKHKESK